MSGDRAARHLRQVSQPIFADRRSQRKTGDPHGWPATKSAERKHYHRVAMRAPAVLHSPACNGGRVTETCRIHVRLYEVAVTIDIEEFPVADFAGFHRLVARYRQEKKWIFRGHADSTWELLPKIGRSPYNCVDDRQVLEAWKRRAIEYVAHRPESDWDWLAIAQHHGLATRLLDWTTNPLNAAYFAVRENRTGPAVIFAANFKGTAVPETQEPWDYHNVIVTYRPRGIVPRIVRQGGLFTVHGQPGIPMNANSANLLAMHKIVIDESYRSSLLAELSFYGVNAATLFPDLDGLSTFVNWTIEAREYWKILQDASAF